MLRESCDPLEVARLADKLGKEAIGVELRVCLPPKWVVAAQSKEVGIASWAVAHCDDKSTLCEIARSRSAKRQGVKKALLENPNFTDIALRAQLEGRASRTKGGVGVPEDVESKRVKALTTEIVGMAKDGSWNIDSILSSVAVEELLALEGVSDTELDEVVRGLLENDQGTGIITRFLLERLGEVDRASKGVELFKRSEVSTDFALGQLQAYPVMEREVLLEVVETLMWRAGSEWNRPKSFDIELTRAVLKSLKEGDIDECDNPVLVKNGFSIASVEELLSSNTKLARKLLSYQSLKGEQLKRYMTAMSTDDKVMTLFVASNDGARVCEVLENFLDHEKITDDWVVSAFDGVFDTKVKDGPLTLLERLSEEHLMGYLSGEISFTRSRRMPTRKEEEAITLRLEGAVKSDTPRWATSTLTPGRVTRMSQAYLNRLVDRVPGVFGALFWHPRVSARAFKKLRATGADIDVIADQMAVAPGESLERMCQVLKAMAKAEAATRERS